LKKMGRVWNWFSYGKSLLAAAWYCLEFYIEYSFLDIFYKYYTPCRLRNSVIFYYVFHIPFVLKFLEVSLRKVFGEPVDKNLAYYTLVYYFPIVACLHRMYICSQMCDQCFQRLEMNELLRHRIERGCSMSKKKIAENYLAWERELKKWMKVTKNIRKRRALEPSTDCLVESTIKTFLLIFYNIFSWIFISKKKEEEPSSNILAVEDKQQSFTDCSGFQDYLLSKLLESEKKKKNKFESNDFSSHELLQKALS